MGRIDSTATWPCQLNLQQNLLRLAQAMPLAGFVSCRLSLREGSYEREYYCACREEGQRQTSS